MAEPLKNLYNDTFFDTFNTSFKKVYPQFNSASFMQDVYNHEWDQKELKERMYHISQCLYKHLPGDYSSALALIVQLVKNRLDENEGMSFEYMFLPDFVERYGLDDFELSVDAMEKITQFTSCEFAVRPFIIRYPERMMKRMIKWSKHSSHQVRRLASEGCRPRLPWAIGLPDFKKDPAAVLPILNNLKEDPSEFVRRSVANNLNDISKDHPELVYQTAQKWLGLNPDTDKLVKHACRTLLKQGHSATMELFGFGSIENLDVSEPKIKTSNVKIGEELAFSFQLKNKSKKEILVRLEYAIYYMKANGSLSPKVFKISERHFDAGKELTIERKHPFKIITTRKFHPGTHKVAIIINGNELGSATFELIEK